VTHLPSVHKLIVSTKNAGVKLEVNQIKRGVYARVFEGDLCEKAQMEFDTFCTMPLVPEGQIYGGKICAALSRQHPRDLFYVKLLLDETKITDDLKKGFIFCLLGDDRPFHEILSPNPLNQESVLKNQFQGMTSDPFTYEDFEITRLKLISTIQNSLSDFDRGFLLDFMHLEPDWSIYPFNDFPAVRWKLMNIEALKNKNIAKYNNQIKALEKVIFK
jgi:hypothetical protein